MENKKIPEEKKDDIDEDEIIFTKEDVNFILSTLGKTTQLTPEERDELLREKLRAGKHPVSSIFDPWPGFCPTMVKAKNIGPVESEKESRERFLQERNRILLEKKKKKPDGT